tara:strand:+ start:2115 stop:3116 length:1002 start_codon:yes stop_codon:yes gene_type:complete
VILNKLGLSLAHFFPPEISNKLSLKSLEILYKLGMQGFLTVDLDNSKSIQKMGMCFPNRIGIAGGLDKNAEYFHILNTLGFGFVEVGTFTLKPQEGNPKPRVHRFMKEQNIVNSLGFNNVGVYEGIKNIEKNKPSFNGILGISIGKSKETKIEDAFKDYLHLIDYVYQHADYIAVNISSPNTENLRNLSLGDYFSSLIEKIMNKREQLAQGVDSRKPIVLKISPDESEENLEKIVVKSMETNVNGLIINNTSINHAKNLKGGISGNYIKNLSEKNLKFARSICGENLTLIASGGLLTKKDIEKRLELSADLIQLYTGFIYRGMDLLKESLEIQ